jgi:putative transcriptional regulator
VAVWEHRRLLLAAAALVLPATVLHAALSPGADTSGRTSFAGELLVASPSMREPFNHAVIFIAQHNRDGALGVVINHPLSGRALAGVLKSLGADTGGSNLRVFLGGPVGQKTAFVLHSADYHGDSTLEIDSRFALSNAADVLPDIATGKGPKKSLVVFGYAGWGPSQLEDELAQGAWVTEPGDPALVFDDDRTKVWRDALALRRSDR